MKWRSLEESAGEPDLRPLGEILAERSALIAKYVSPEVQAVHARVVADLKNRRLAEDSLQVGARAPCFELPDQNGKRVATAELVESGRLVVCFIRGRWCPFCVGQLEGMNLIVAELKAAGAQLIAVSAQTVQQSFFMHDQHQLRFPLLSDRGNRVARQFGLVYHVPDDQQAIYRQAFVNLPLANGDDSWELPIPATYILGRDQTVVYASANEDYTERPEPLEILEKLSS